MKYHYRQSLEILKLINNSNDIFINIHKNPDLDSYGSALAMNRFVKSLGKKSTIITEFPIDDWTRFLPGVDQIKQIDYQRFEFGDDDLLLILDTASYDRVTGDKKISLPKILYFVVDHHQSNDFDKKNKLVDIGASATAEIIYKLFLDWRVKIDNQTATVLLAGIMGDTVCLKYPKDPQGTIAVVSELLKLKGNYQKIVNQVYDNLDFSFVKLIGSFLEKIELAKTKSGKQFVWSAVSYDQFQKFGRMRGAREAAADMFFRSIKGADFGVAILEVEKGKIEMSFRSKKTDVSVIAKSFGGGGHKNAAGATVEWTTVPSEVEGEFQKTVKKVIRQIVAVA